MPAGRKPRHRIAKGPPRPPYLANRDMDRMMIMFVALVSETLALRDRLDTHELLLARDGGLTPEAIEAFRPDPAIEQAREERRLALLRRVFRVFGDEFEDYRDEAAVEEEPT